MNLKAWVLASRPKTLPAAIAPVMTGSSLAFHDGSFQAIPALLCMAFALLIQIATNFANDYFDFKKGTDNPNRIGPKRAVAQGWIRPKSMLLMTAITLGCSLVVGLGLIPFGGYSLVIVGVMSIFCAIAYTGGPFPLAYLGLGDLFVLVFFGWIATAFTYFVQAGNHSVDAWLLGTTMGCLSVNLLLVNNYRDHKNDRECRKRTTVVRFGLTYAQWQYRIALLLSCASVALLSFRLTAPWLLLACMPLLPGFRIANKLQFASDARLFDRFLQQTAGILILHAAVVSTLLLFA
jgi:1,4-dihydroxy-2-naphthoate polyprenyltransferase